MRQVVGFGLTVGWLWLFFLCGPVFNGVIKQWPGNPDLYFQLFLISSAITFLVAGKLIGSSSLLAKKSLLIIAAMLMSAGPGLISLLPLFKNGFVSRNQLIIYILTAGGGLGGTIMILAWLETFLPVSVKSFGFLYTGGIVIASVLLFGGAILNAYAGVGITMTIPWLALLIIINHPRLNLEPREHLTANTKISVKQPFPLRLIMLIILFYAAGGLMFKLVGLKYVFAGFFWISNISYMAVVILAGLAIYCYSDLDLRLLSRPVLPLLAAGFILFPFLKGDSAMTSFLLLQAGFALFDMYTWLLIVYIARGYSKPVTVLGLGMFWIIISMFGGNLAFSIFSWLMPLKQPVDSLAVIAGLITLLASLIFQDDKNTFAGWEIDGSRTDPPDKFKAAKPIRPEYEQFIENRNLTPRETEILALILKGRNNPFIREKLNISPNTLKFHLRNIYEKFAVNNRQELLDLFEKQNVGTG